MCSFKQWSTEECVGFGVRQLPVERERADSCRYIITLLAAAYLGTGRVMKQASLGSLLSRLSSRSLLESGGWRLESRGWMMTFPSSLPAGLTLAP